MSSDPRVDDYIARAGDFAKPILERVRERVHAVVPGAEEAIKWGHPNYLCDGKIILGTAAFKAHASVHFWNAPTDETTEGMGHLGKLKDVADLPADLDRQILEAVKRRGEPARAKEKKPPRPVGELHPDFAAALAENGEARRAFDGFAPSHQREYVEWVGEAKQDATRTRRISQAVEWLAEGKRRNWKYENC